MGWFPNRDFVNSIKVVFYIGVLAVVVVVGLVVVWLGGWL